MKKLFIVSFLIITSLSFHSKAHANACTVTSGVTTLPVGDSCMSEPESYGITLYSKYLCTAAPTVPADGVAYDLSNCVQTMSSSNGEVVRVTSTSSNVALTTTVNRPPNGSYTHGVMIFKNEFLIKQNIIFDQDTQGDSQGDDVPPVGAIFCSTVSGSGDEDDCNSLVCSTSQGTAGEFAAALPNFNVGGAYEGTASETFASGNIMSAYLLNTSNELADDATEAAAGAKMFGLQEFATAVVVDKDTKGFNMSFNVSTGSSIWQNSPGSCDGIIDKAGTFSVGSGPFQVLLTPVQY
jgi:hypothetical protein